MVTYRLAYYFSDISGVCEATTHIQEIAFVH